MILVSLPQQDSSLHILPYKGAPETACLIGVSEPVYVDGTTGHNHVPLCPFCRRDFIAKRRRA